MRVRSFLALSLSCITILLPMQTYASTQESFKTEEYGASGALDLVNVAEAYGDCHKLKPLHHYDAMNFFSDGRAYRPSRYTWSRTAIN